MCFIRTYIARSSPQDKLNHLCVSRLAYSVVFGRNPMREWSELGRHVNRARSCLAVYLNDSTFAGPRRLVCFEHKCVSFHLMRYCDRLLGLLQRLCPLDGDDALQKPVKLQHVADDFKQRKEESTQRNPEVAILPLCFENGIIETQFLLWRQNRNLIWMVGLAMLILCVSFVLGANNQLFVDGDFGASLGIGLLMCLASSILVLVHRPSTPPWLFQLLLIIAAYDCTALAVCTNVQGLETTEGFSNVVGELDLVATMMLLFSSAFSWRWATTLSAPCFGLQVMSWNDSTSLRAFTGWLLSRLIAWGLCVSIVCDIELRERRHYALLLKRQDFGTLEEEPGAKDQLVESSKLLSDEVPSPNQCESSQMLASEAPSSPNHDKDAVLDNAHRGEADSPDIVALFAAIQTGFKPRKHMNRASPFQVPIIQASPEGNRSMVCSTQDCLGHSSLCFRTGTLLLCKLDMGVRNPSKLQKKAEAFHREAAISAAATHGAIHSIEADTISISWNLFQYNPNHQTQACYFALRMLKHTKKQCKIVIVSSNFVVGLLNFNNLKTPVMHGKYLQVARRLLRLNTKLQTRYCGLGGIGFASTCNP